MQDRYAELDQLQRGRQLPMRGEVVQRSRGCPEIFFKTFDNRVIVFSLFRQTVSKLGAYIKHLHTER